MSKLFISHSSLDDGFVRELRAAIADHGQAGWIDSRELRGGDLLWPEIQRAIEEASGYAVVISTNALQSKWVGKELKFALELQKERGKEKFPVIPLSLNGTKLGGLELFFDDEPLYIPISSDAGGVEAAMHAILVATRKRKPIDDTASSLPISEPLEELVLELTDLKIREQDGIRRATAQARLVYEPATPGQPHVHSAQSWRLIAPIGPIEAEELRWYLEKYAVWPSHYFADRAKKVEENLAKWGKLLYDVAMPVAHRENIMNAWSALGDNVGRRFSVQVDVALEAGAPEADVKAAQEAATLLLGLPWELLYDGRVFLFQGARPTRVRRRLPATEKLPVAVVATPIRILLITARPEDDSCAYIDHRASALPLVDAMETLPGLVKLHVLSPPTLPALREELDRARSEKQPYHVVHFDGHGVYDKSVGLGGLCFEHSDDTGKLDNRRHVTVFTSELGPLLRDHRIPLVFLEACQTAQAEKASESVASELLKVGVASVVAMSHSVLVETARRFVGAFYQKLAHGARVGDAMLEGQRRLNDDKSRGQIFGVGELKLHDWFVPVLFQEKDDPQLFRTMPAKQTQEDFRTALKVRLGELPPLPETGFVGRSRELLALQRLLFRGAGFQPANAQPDTLKACPTKYAVIRGQGGEGKTALAAEFARWMVRSHQVRRTAFVSVETHSTARAVLDAIGRQIVGPEFTAAGDLAEAIQQVERALREHPTLLVVDNMESILEPPFDVGRTKRSAVPASQATNASPESSSASAVPELRSAWSGLQVLSEDKHRELTAILALCERMLKVGDTRIIFTSRESLPAPFDAARQRRELHQLDREDAVKLVERALNVAGDSTFHQPPGASPRFPGTNLPPGNFAHGPHEPAASAVRLMDAQREEIEQLVEAVHCHARTLALLAPALRSRGVDATRKSLVELMVEMERRFPGNREQSVFASVDLSLRRMSAVNQNRARVLRVFHGGVNIVILRMMMQWEAADVASLAGELIETGLATPNRYNHLTLNPALCPYLRGVERLSESLPETPRLGDSSDNDLKARWITAMRQYVRFLDQQHQNAEVAATLTVLELPNLFALLDLVHTAGEADSTIDLATSLYSLLQALGKPRLLERVGQVRDAAATTLGDTWNHARFEATRTRIEQQLASGRLRELIEGAQQLLLRARAAGEVAYPVADYDLAYACWLLARVFNTAGSSEQALPLLDEARQRFEAVAKERDIEAAGIMACHCFADEGNCLLRLGRLDEAAAAYEETVRRSEQLNDDRQVAVGKGQLGSVRIHQRRYPEALAAYAEARERFTRLDEPGSVATAWHQTGVVYLAAGQPEAEEDAYRKSLAIQVRLGNVAGQAVTLGQLGILHASVNNRPEQAEIFYRQAADKYFEISEMAGEGRQRNNLASLLRTLRRLDGARQEIRRAIECKASLGHAGSVWNAWSILADIETDAGNPAAAAEATGKSIACYLAYRRDGGENHNTDGRICLAVTQSLLTGNPDEAASLLQQLAANPDAAWLLTFIRALQAIVTGNRDRSLADAPDLDCTMAAEILFLIETLEHRP